MHSLTLRVFILGLSGLLHAQTTVENGQLPKGKTYTIAFVKDLKFGADEDDGVYHWALDSTRILPRNNGNMYIVDPREKRILEFDSRGKFIRVAAREGSGPGEIQTPVAVSRQTNGSICLLNTSAAPGQYVPPTLMFFNEDMSFNRSLQPKGRHYVPAMIKISPDGKMLGGGFAGMHPESGEARTTTSLVRLEDWTSVKDFHSLPNILLDSTRMKDPNYLSDYLGARLKRYNQLGVFAFSPDGTIYSAVVNRYSIKKWGSDLKKPLMIINRSHKPIINSSQVQASFNDALFDTLLNFPGARDIFTQSVLDKAVEKSEQPPVRNPIYGLLAMPNGLLLVIHNVDYATRLNQADIFDKAGRFLGQVSLEDYALLGFDGGSLQPRMVFYGKYAYTITTDAEGDNRAVRFTWQLVEKRS